MKLFLQTLFLIAMALVIVLAAGIIPMPAFLTSNASSSSNEGPPSRSLAQPVSVIRAANNKFIQTVRLTGSLVAREEILVSPELSGLRITRVLAAEGEHVSKGQLLAELVDTQLKTHLAQNDAAMAKANAAIAQARSQITQAQASYREAKSSHERAIMLRKKGHISVSVLDTQRAGAQTAKARWISAQDGLQLAIADTQQIKAQRAELLWKLSNTKIRAPGEGIISRKTAKLGALASGAGAPLFRITARGEIELEAEVAEGELPQLMSGQIAHITLPGHTDLKAKLRLVYPEVDKTTRLGRVRLFIGVMPDLRIGTFARAIVETATSTGVGVPLSSLLFTDDGAKLQIVESGKIATRTVITGLRAKGMIEIKSGLKVGALVVVRAGTFLRNGDLVKSILPKGEAAGKTNGGTTGNISGKATDGTLREAMR